MGQCAEQKPTAHLMAHLEAVLASHRLLNALLQPALGHRVCSHAHLTSLCTKRRGLAWLNLYRGMDPHSGPQHSRADSREEQGMNKDLT